ncbi:hypothetical protein BJY27_000096 [Streptomyces rapamycinicus]|uniref:PPM-type phosphatase domain-containing protein n=1 Tax=Streptomyces rapamycinicus TaxID=1226757 RepID=A0ABR6L9X7_9ACTN|nr:SpoIIE family protein phosphatase [Streptomyces rapamycinicus]MBB4779135.1 hypothetical protein [Streptomyces rapamycinicus]
MPPDEVLSRLDEQVIRLTEAEADPRHPAATTMAATCLYAVYDPVTRTCTMARAGHPRPRSSTRTATSPSPTCPPEHRSASDWSPSSP